MRPCTQGAPDSSGATRTPPCGPRGNRDAPTPRRHSREYLVSFLVSGPFRPSGDAQTRRDSVAESCGFHCWGTWTRTKNKGTRNLRVANYTIPQGARPKLVPRIKSRRAARPLPNRARALRARGSPRGRARRRIDSVLPSSSIDSNSGGETRRPLSATRSGPYATRGLSPSPSISADGRAPPGPRRR